MPGPTCPRDIFISHVILVPITAYFQIEGYSQIVSAAESKNISLSLVSDLSFGTLLSIFSLTFGWGLGYFGQPHILTKFMGIKDPSEMRKAKYLGISWQIFALSSAALVGFIGIAFFPNGLEKPELIFVEMTRSLFLPFSAAFIICGIFAANISTMDAQILVAATVWAEDFYKKFFHKEASDRQILFASRIGVVFFALLAFSMAYGQSATIISIVEYAWSGLGSTFGPLILTALYSKKVNKYGQLPE